MAAGDHRITRDLRTGSFGCKQLYLNAADLKPLRVPAALLTLLNRSMLYK